MTQELYNPFYYEGDGTLDQYAFGFYISSQERLYVVHTDTSGNETDYVLNVNYTITFNSGTSGTGFITLLAGNLPAGEKIALHNIENLTQETLLRNKGPYFEKSTEEALDKIVRICQQLNIDILKSLRLSPGTSEQSFNPLLPGDPADNIGAAIIVNASGNGFIYGLPTGSTLNSVSDTATIDLTLAAGQLSGIIVIESIANTHISPTAAIAWTKLASGNNYRLVATNGSGVVSEAAAITASRVLISDANGIPTHSTVTSTTLGYLDATSSIQTQLNSKLNLSGGSMTGTLVLAGAPTANNDAATKAYVDAAAGAGTHWTTAVRVATTAAGTLASDFEDGDTVDGVTLATGDRILIKDQASADENGIYTVNASGAPTRAADANDWDAELVGIAVAVSEGTANAGTSWLCISPSGGTFGVDDVDFVYYPPGQFAEAGDGLERVSNVLSLKLDGSTLTASASGSKVAAGGITNTEINASAGIAFSKMASLTVNRALVSDGSGVVIASAATATEVGYLSGVSSAIQTQLDGKIASSLMTTNGDLITRAAGVPARIGVGSNGQVLTVSGGAPVWASPSVTGDVSYSVFRGTSSAGSTNLTTGAWTPFTLLGAADLSGGTPFSRSVNDLTPPFVGKYKCRVSIPKLILAGSSGEFSVRVRNISTGATVAVLSYNLNDTYSGPVEMFGEFNISNISHVHQVQYYANSGGGGPSISNFAVGGETAPRFTIELELKGS